MTTELSTNLVQINFKEIIDNSLNKRYWEKMWHIFAYDNVVVTVNLYDIEIENNNVGLRVRTTNYNLDHYDKSDNVIINLPIDRYHQEVFQNKLLGAVHRTLITLERRAAYLTDEYDELVEIARDKENNARNELIAFLDDEGITNEDVREAYLEQHDPSLS